MRLSQVTIIFVGHGELRNLYLLSNLVCVIYNKRRTEHAEMTSVQSESVISISNNAEQLVDLKSNPKQIQMVSMTFAAHKNGDISNDVITDHGENDHDEGSKTDDLYEIKNNIITPEKDNNNGTDSDDVYEIAETITTPETKQNDETITGTLTAGNV